MNQQHYANWHECFQQFRTLSEGAQNLLHNCAVQHFLDRGFEEIGTSDINHSLFGMWKMAGMDWQKAMIAEVENYACSLR